VKNVRLVEPKLVSNQEDLKQQEQTAQNGLLLRKPNTFYYAQRSLYQVGKTEAQAEEDRSIKYILSEGKPLRAGK
jgi:hypothetical protein